MAVAGGEIKVVMTLDTNDFSIKTIKAGQTISDLKRSLDTTGESVKNIEKRMTSFGSRMRDLTLTLSIARFAFRDFQDMILAFPTAVLRITGEFQRMTTLLEGMSAESDKTKRKLDALAGKKYIIELAMNSPFKIEAIQDAFVKFKSVGLDPAAGGLKALVDSVAKFGGSSDLLHRSSIAVQQMVGKGVVSMEELRQQLGEAIPDAMQIMATGAGVTVGELVKQVSKGTVEASTAVGNMLAVMAVENQNAAEAMSRTWPGTLDRISTSFSLFMNNIGENKFGENMQKQAEKLLATMNSINTVNLARGIGDWLNGVVNILATVIEFFQRWGSEVKAVAYVLSTLYVGAKLGKMLTEYKDLVFKKIAAIKEEVVATRKAEVEKTLAMADTLTKKRMMERIAYTESDKLLLAQKAKLAQHNSDIVRMEAIKNNLIRQQGDAGAVHFEKVHGRYMYLSQQKVAQSTREIAALAAIKAAHQASFVDLSKQVASQTAMATALGQTSRSMGVLKGVMTGMGAAFTAMGGWVTAITAGLIFAAMELIKWWNKAKTAKEDLENERTGRTGTKEFDEFNESKQIEKQAAAVEAAKRKLAIARSIKQPGEKGYDGEYVAALEALYEQKTAKLIELQDKHARLRVNSTKATAQLETDALRHSTETQIEAIRAESMKKVSALRAAQQADPKINNSKQILDIDRKYVDDALVALKARQSEVDGKLKSAKGAQQAIFAAQQAYITDQIQQYESMQANLAKAGTIVTVTGTDSDKKTPAQKAAEKYADLVTGLKQYIEQQEYANESGVRASASMKKIQDIQEALTKGSKHYSEAQKVELQTLADTILQNGIRSIQLKSEKADRDYAIKQSEDATRHEAAKLAIMVRSGQITEETAAVMGALTDARNRDIAVSEEEKRLKELNVNLSEAQKAKDLELVAQIKAQIIERERSVEWMRKEGAQYEELAALKAKGDVDELTTKNKNASSQIELDLAKQIRDEYQARIPLNELETAMFKARNDVQDKYAEILLRNKNYLENTLEASIKQLEDMRQVYVAFEDTAGVERIDQALSGLRNSAARVTSEMERLKGVSNVMSSDAAKAAFTWVKALAPIGNSFEKAFGKAGATINAMVTSFAKLKDSQIAYGKELERIKKLEETNPKLAADQMQQYNNQMIANSIQTYADMAGTAKSYFDEQSTAYKVLSGIEQAMYAIKFAMQLKAMLMDTTFTAESIANSGTRASADGVAAFAKTLASLPFPWNVAAGAAVVAALVGMGVAMSGGSAGSVSMSAARQESQGTGTVLGDPTAKSNSLSNALEMLTEVNTETMNYSARMADSLGNIEKAMTGVSSMIYQTPGLTSGNMTGVAEGTKSGFLGFSSKTVSIGDSGLMYKGLISGIAEGLKMYTDVTTTKSSFWGLSKKTSTKTIVEDAPDDISQQFQMIFNDISDSLISAGRVLGESADILETKLASIEIDLGMASLKGLKGEELSSALNAILSGVADDMAAEIMPGFKKFQEVGEGYFETIVRVAVGTEYAVATMGLFGQSLGESSAAMIENSMALLGLTDGIEGLKEKVTYFYENFYSEFERLIVSGRDLGNMFADIGQGVPKTAAGFRDLVNAQDLTTDSGRRTWNALMDLAPAFMEVTRVFEEALAAVRNTTAATIEEMRLSTMSQEKQYEYMRNKSGELETLLATAIDPNVITSLTEELNATARSAWALLGEEEKKVKLAEYEAYLTEIEKIANGRLQLAQDAITAVDGAGLGETIVTSIDDAMERVAVRMETAAAAMEAAARVPVTVTGSATVYIETSNSETSAEVGLV